MFFDNSIWAHWNFRKICSATTFESLPIAWNCRMRWKPSKNDSLENRSEEIPRRYRFYAVLSPEYTFFFLQISTNRARETIFTCSLWGKTFFKNEICPIEVYNRLSNDGRLRGSVSKSGHDDTINNYNLIDTRGATYASNCTRETDSGRHKTHFRQNVRIRSRCPAVFWPKVEKSYYKAELIALELWSYS